MPNAGSRPTHIDIPPNDTVSTSTNNEDMATSPNTPSSQRLPPSRGILKNPLRRPSYLGEGDVVARTDDERQLDEDVEPRPRQGGEQSVLSSTSETHLPFESFGLTLHSGLTWDEANIALTEIQKDSLM